MSSRPAEDNIVRPCLKKSKVKVQLVIAAVGESSEEQL